MAIPLHDKPNVTAPGGDYPYGDIKDNPGDGTGTPVNRLVTADFHQFFARMLAISGVAANGLPENNANGFQYFEAMLKVISDKMGATLRKIVDIGPWDMDTNVTTSVEHGLPDHTKIRAVSAVIVDDVGNVRPLNRVSIPAGVVQGGVVDWNASDITLLRLTGGDFDNLNHDDAVMNRGHVLIDYAE